LQQLSGGLRAETAIACKSSAQTGAHREVDDMACPIAANIG
jgi:hypothetical protein